MKKKLLQIFVVFVLFSSVLYSQILNNSFENWSNSNPDNWQTNNSNLEPIILTVTQSNESHLGSSAARLEIMNFSGLPLNPSLISGNEDADGFAVSQRYASLRGYYKFAPTVATQFFNVSAYMMYQENLIGLGSFIANTAVGSYTEFECQIAYYTLDIPDTIVISIFLLNQSFTAEGAVAFVDDLSLSGTVDVKEITSSQTPTSYELMQNYPNPFNPSTKIEYSIPEESFVVLKVYNLIGQEITTLISQHQKAGTYRTDFNAEGMQSGIYIAKLNADGFIRSMKMTLLK